MLYYPVITEHANPPSLAVAISLFDRALITAYPFCMGKSPLRVLRWFGKVFGDKSVILDSGVFTLLKDYRAVGGTPDAAYFDRYFENYKRVLACIPSHWIVVELDVHVWPAFQETGLVEKYRQWFADSGWSDRTVHVWHPSDPGSIFSEYLQRFNRVASSQQEIRLVNMQEDRRVEDLQDLLRENQGLLPGKHIHTLGQASPEFAEAWPDYISYDVASWSAITHWGRVKAGPYAASYNKKSRVITAPPSVLAKIKKHMPMMIDWYKRHPSYRNTPVRIEYLRQLAAGYLVFDLYHRGLRLRNAKSNFSVVDPVDYWS